MGGIYNTFNLPGSSAQVGKARTYTNFGVFPVGTVDGELAIAQDTGVLYYWSETSSSWVAVAGTSSGADYYPEPVRTLTGTDITNKYILLSKVPTDANRTRLTVVGGIEQEYSVDFEVTGDNGGLRLSWDGLTLQTILEVGDKIIITIN